MGRAAVVDHAAPRPHVFPALPASTLARMSQVLEHWQRLGAVYVDLPWCAPEVFVEATRPATARRAPETPEGLVVASGEQSFFWLAHTGQLPDASLMIGWTPCFRDEPAHDTLHHHCFIKAELFAWVAPWTGGDTWRAVYPPQLKRLIVQAQSWFHDQIRQRNPNACAPQIIQVEEHMWDLVHNGVELGSYGCRLHPTLNRPYLYGTALAEPRLSTALLVHTAAVA